MPPRLQQELNLACERGLLRRLDAGESAAAQQRDLATSDLAEAKHSLAHTNAKWALAQAYYAAFHALNAWLMDHGFRERGHHALGRVAKEVLAVGGVLTAGDAAAFAEVVKWREQAMYHGEWFPDQAETAVALAERIVETLSGQP